MSRGPVHRIRIFGWWVRLPRRVVMALWGVAGIRCSISYNHTRWLFESNREHYSIFAEPVSRGADS